MELDLGKLVHELAARFPEVRPIAPLEVLGSGFGNLVLETASGVVFRIARDSATGARFRLEQALLTELADRLRVALPVPQWQAFDLSAAPHGASGHRKLRGAPLDSAPLAGARARRLGGQIAELLVAVHRIRPTELATPLPTLEPGRVLTDDFTASVRAALVLDATDEDIRALDEWLAKAPQALAVSGRPVLTHGDLWYENLLVEAGPRLTGVLDWSAAAFSEPARDLAPLAYNGEKLVAATAGAYAVATGGDAEELRARAADFLLLRELLGLYQAARHDPAELADAKEKVLSLLRRRRTRRRGRRPAP